MNWGFLGASLGLVAVAAGAFGAHGLAEHLAQIDQKALSWWQTAAQYHLVHALALVAVGILQITVGDRAPAAWTGWAFLIGVVLFCGSLYAMGLSGIRWLGAITPIGGVGFLIGWIGLAMSFYRLTGERVS